MTVEIVDPSPDPSVKKEIICRRCGAKLSYLPIDVKERHGTDYGGGPDGAEWIVCPKCNNDCIIRSW